MIEQKVEAYIERWGGGMSRGGNERANLQMFITELCTLLDLPQPEPATAKRSDNAYIFERSVTELFADGGKTTRALDSTSAAVSSSKARTPASKPTATAGMPPSPKR